MTEQCIMYVCRYRDARVLTAICSFLEFVRRNNTCHTSCSVQPIPVRTQSLKQYCKQSGLFGRRKDVTGVTNKINAKVLLTFRHRASCILGQAFHYSPENAFYIFNQQIYFII